MNFWMLQQHRRLEEGRFQKEGRHLSKQQDLKKGSCEAPVMDRNPPCPSNAHETVKMGAGKKPWGDLMRL